MCSVAFDFQGNPEAEKPRKRGKDERSDLVLLFLLSREPTVGFENHLCKIDSSLTKTLLPLWPKWEMPTADEIH